MAQTQQPQARPPAYVPPVADSAREVVSVACKLPNGFVMRGFLKTREVELVLGGGSRDVDVHRPTGEETTIGGTAARFGVAPPILVNGYRITRNVPKALWDNWYEANRNSDLVKNHIVYAAEAHDDAKAWSREHESVLTGLEGIDPDEPGKRVRGIQRAEKPR